MKIFGRRDRERRGPEGLWHTCRECGEMAYEREFEMAHKVCPKCGFHERLSAPERIALLLDEPEAGLDRESVTMLKSLLDEWTGAGRTVVMTTHDVELGLSWAHWAAVLFGGRIHFPASSECLDDGELRQMLAASPEPGR